MYMLMYYCVINIYLDYLLRIGITSSFSPATGKDDGTHCLVMHDGIYLVHSVGYSNSHLTIRHPYKMTYTLLSVLYRLQSQ